MPDTAIRLAALAAAMTDVELADLLSIVGESVDLTPEQRAGIDEAVIRLKADRSGGGNEAGEHNMPA